MPENNVKATREARQISQADLARLVGVSRQTLSAIEANKQEPSLQVALRIAQALRTPLEELFSIRDEQEMNTLSAQLESYQDVLNRVFGEGACTINTNQDGVNNIVGGITWKKDGTFESFSRNYIERLERLKSLYDEDDHCSATIKRLAQEVGTGQGIGAYAELGAIDFVGRMVRNVISQPARLDVDLPSSATFADCLAEREKANLDGYIADLHTYFDVKTLRDITDGILSKPIRELSQKYNANILVERDYAYDYTALHGRLADIKKELEEGLKSRQSHVRIKSVDDLAFRISWPPGVNHAVGVLDPYKMALVRHKGIFDYADKFVRDAPFILILVTPPWTDTTLIDFQDVDNTYYRALSRRVFCQYLTSHDIHPEFDKTYNELSKAISMIVFLKLHDGLGKSKEPIGAHVFANPNANHSYPTLIRSFFNEQKVAIQDLEWDNY